MKKWTQKNKKTTIKYISDENSIFESYSKKGCIFECSVKFAIEKVGCLPWDFPVSSAWDDTNLEICYSINTESQSFNKVAMFYEAMHNDSNLKQCQCLPDCEQTIYDTQVSTGGKL